MALNDVYELVVQQRLHEQDVTNVFHYHQVLAFAPGPPTIAQALAEEWRDQKLDALLDVQSAECVTVGISVRNLYDASDAYTLVLSEPGSHAAAQDTLPTFNAVMYALQGDNPAVGNGRKAIGGITEVAQVDGVITDTGFIPFFDALATALEEPVTVGLVIQDPVFILVIVKRVREGTPGAYTYRLPANQLEAVLSAVTVALWNALISSQLSRKIGVGS